MAAAQDRTIVVTGATGLQGSAVTRYLLRAGWSVRALTRRPTGRRAVALASAGANVMRADLLDPPSLRRSFAGAHGVYSVQNPVLCGVAAEVQQGKNVADAARAAGVQHIVYGSAGIGRKGTGIPSWESKVEIENYMKRLRLPLTILRPMAFMELMTEKKFYPAMSTWHVMPALMGSTRKVYWLCVEDLAAIAAHAFLQPDNFTGKEFDLTTDAQSIDECRLIYRDVKAKDPPRFPLPVWIFERLGFVGEDLSIMWRWLRTAALDADPAPTRALLPQASSVRTWLIRSHRSS